MPSKNIKIKFESLIEENKKMVYLWLTNKDNDILGTSSLLIDLETNYAILERIDIKEQCQKQGYGTLFINGIFKLCNEKQVKKLYLLADPNNPTINKFYEKMGFTNILPNKTINCDYEININNAMQQLINIKITNLLLEELTVEETDDDLLDLATGVIKEFENQGQSAASSSSKVSLIEKPSLEQFDQDSQTKTLEEPSCSYN